VHKLRIDFDPRRLKGNNSSSVEDLKNRKYPSKQQSNYEKGALCSLSSNNCQKR
jgi:hypothetical protein